MCQDVKRPDHDKDDEHKNYYNKNCMLRSKNNNNMPGYKRARQ
jgi:hypothetical protein